MLIKKSFPRCYSNPFMLGTALSRRQSDANKEWDCRMELMSGSRRWSVLCLEMFWYAEERKPGNTNQSPLWVQFDVWVLNIDFFSLQCVCILNNPYFGLTVEIAYFLWPGSSGLTPSPLFSDPNYIIHLICSNSLLLFPLSLSHQQLEPISRAFILSNSGGLLGLLCGFCFLFDIRPW